MHVALIGTYPPRRCGIATFTADVEGALKQNGVTVTVVPVVDDDEVAAGLMIRRNDRSSYVAAARSLNDLDVDVTLIQHEFGIFGGDAGAFVLSLAAHLDMPFAVTMHTVLAEFTKAQASVVKTLAGRATVMTVMTESALQLLAQQHLASAESVVVIPHGAPDELFDVRDVPARREWFGVPQGVPVMTTFGLLSEGKGIEVALRAVAALTARHPDLHYVVAGRTHPEVVRHDGERYRRSLELLSDRLGLSERVHFVDRFLAVDELADLLGISSLVCTPYRGEDQSVSGVLTFALAAGRPVVSTPFRYAEALLADGAGRIAGSDDIEGFAVAIASLLDGPVAASARRAARTASSTMRWPRVGADLRRTLELAVSDGRERAAIAPVIAPAIAPAVVGRGASRSVRHDAPLGIPEARSGPTCSGGCSRSFGLHRSTAGVEPDWPTRSLADAALGLVAASSIDSSWDPLLDPVLHAVRTWQPTNDRRWRWFEPELRYDNVRLPEVLIRRRFPGGRGTGSDPLGGAGDVRLSTCGRRRLQADDTSLSRATKLSSNSSSWRISQAKILCVMNPPFSPSGRRPDQRRSRWRDRPHR